MRYLVVITFYVMLNTAINAQQSAFQYAYTSSYGTVQSRGVAEGPDGYFSCGMVAPSGSIEGAVIHYDHVGDTLWSYRFMYSPQDIFNDVCANSDSGCTVTGHHVVNNLIRMTVLRLDKNGNILWSNNYEEQGFQSNGRKVIATNDGGFVVISDLVGPAYSTGVIKLDANGNVLWSRKFVTDYGGYKIMDVFEGADSTINILNMYNSPTIVNNVRHIHLDHDGTVLWERTYGSPYADFPIGIMPRPQGGFVIGAWYPHYIVNGVVVGTALIFTDSNGRYVAQKWHVNGPDNVIFQDMHYNSSGDIAMCGMTYPVAVGYGNATYATFTPNGNFINGYHYSTPEAEEIFATCSNQNGGSILAGDLLTGIPNSFYLVRTDSSYSSGCNLTPIQMQPYIVSIDTATINTGSSHPQSVTPITFQKVGMTLTITDMCTTAAYEETETQIEWLLYPNPAANNCTLSHPESAEESVVSIQNAFGETIRSMHTTGNSTVLNLDGLASGLYFVCIDSSEHRSTIKLVVE